MNTKTNPNAVRAAVRKAYGKVAQGGGGAGAAPPGCCGGGDVAPVDAARLGYSPAEREAIPAGADLGLGCGNPTGIAGLAPGETVLDLGCGAGMDVFLAARQVGATGRVIGVDMTPEMLARARENAARQGAVNVEFRLGEIEHLPLADASVDVVISNCVVNLSPDKPQVFREVFRVLRPGGRMAISDVVARGELPREIQDNPALIATCVGGAAPIDALRRMLALAGFDPVRVTPRDGSRDFIRDWAPGTGIEEMVVSATIEAVRPAG
ncbi:MAG: arsenite methyltransferase [Nitrospirae bacterium]|nr:arsenite methyltransferase [Nitrospirota bacterium]